MPEAGMGAARAANPRVMGFDFGMKRIGMATGDRVHRTSHGLSTVGARDGIPHWRAVERLVAEWRPGTLVVGVPPAMDQTAGGMAARARRFGATLQRRFGIPVVYVDEHLTTVAADAMLVEQTAAGKSLQRRRLKYRDRLAAELIVRAHIEGG